MGDLPASSRLALSEHQYRVSGAWGLSTAIDLFDCNPETVRDPRAVQHFARVVCHLIQVPMTGRVHLVRRIVNATNRGYSMVHGSGTTRLSASFDEQLNGCFLDLFHAGYYDPSSLGQFAALFFEAKGLCVQFLIRGDQEGTQARPCNGFSPPN